MPTRVPESESENTWLNAFGTMIENMVLHNFFIGEFVGGMFNPVKHHESHWVYAYSQNQTLLQMSLEELQNVPDLKMQYLQLDS